MKKNPENPPSDENRIIGGRIAAELARRRWDAADLAKKVGVSRQAVEKWIAGGGMRASTARKVSQELQIELQDTLTERAVPLTIGNARPANVQLPNTDALPVDLPVLGIAVGGTDGDFTFNGVVVDYVKRAPGIARAKDAYAIRLIGSSMEPWAKSGDLLCIDPNRPPADGDYVVIEIAGADESAPKTAMVKKLIGKTPTLFKLAQHNPAREFTVPRAKVATFHKILTLSELLS